MKDRSQTIDEILLLHHTHTDIGYTHAQPVLWELQHRFIDRAIDLCEEFADAPEVSRARWTCEVSEPVMHWMKRAKSRQLDRFRALAEAGLMDVGALQYNGTPLLSAAQHARGMANIAVLRRELRASVRCGINHDVNGIAWPVADLLLDADVKMLLMGVNVTLGGIVLESPLAFKWLSPSGRPLLAFNGEIYHSFDYWARVNSESTDVTAAGLSEYLARLAPTYPYNFAVMTATWSPANDNNPPNPALARLARKWNDEGRSPAIRFVTASQLADRVAKGVATCGVATHAGDWPDYWASGVGSSATETRVNRNTRARVLAAEALRATVATASETAALDDRAISENAWANLNLYDEHTWGVHSTTMGHLTDAVNEQWSHKSNYAYAAKSATSLLLRDALERLVGNPREGAGVKSVLVFNPSPVARTEYVRAPVTWTNGTWIHNASNVQMVEVLRDLWDDRAPSPDSGALDVASLTAGPIELPAFGYCCVPPGAFSHQTPSVELAQGEDFIESPHFRLSFDQSSGRVTSLVEKASGAEVIDVESPHALFGFLRETNTPGAYAEGTPWQGREPLLKDANCEKRVSGWPEDWQATRCGPTRLIACRVERSLDGVALVARWEAPGVDDLQTRINLPALRPVVELTATFAKRDVRTPEGIYFSFPLNLQNGWRAHYDAAGVAVEVDAEQLPGGCRDYLCVGGYVALHDAERCITLCCPDAPLVQLGGFNFTKLLTAVPREKSPLLLAWPINNFWMTNFRASQPGLIKLRYELRATAGAFDPAAAFNAATAAFVPRFEVHPVVGVGPADGNAVEVQGRDVACLSVVAAEDGTGLLVQLVNHGQEDVEATVRVPAWNTATTARVRLRPRRITVVPIARA